MSVKTKKISSHVVMFGYDDKWINYPTNKIRTVAINSGIHPISLNLKHSNWRREII